MNEDDDQPLYERVGREPLEDAELEAAIAAYLADHPDETWPAGHVAHLRRLNTEAVARAAHAAAVQRIIDQATDDGIALPWAVAEQALLEQRDMTERQRIEHARRSAKTYAEQDAKKQPLPRLPGRKKGSRKLSEQQIRETYATLKAELKRTPTQLELCDNLPDCGGVRTLQDAIKDYGLPWPLD